MIVYDYLRERMERLCTSSVHKNHSLFMQQTTSILTQPLVTLHSPPIYVGTPTLPNIR